MTLEVETVVAVSLLMAVFSAVAAIGTSIVLGAGFERLRNGFDIVRKQTGFFSDALHKLEQKVEVVDKQALKFGESIHILEGKVTNVGDQANIFSDSMQKLERKVDLVDKQAGFFGDAIHKLEQKVEDVSKHETRLAEKIESHQNIDLISTDKTDALVCRAENLLEQVSVLASDMNSRQILQAPSSGAKQSQIDLSIPKNLDHFVNDTPKTINGEVQFQ